MRQDPECFSEHQPQSLNQGGGAPLQGSTRAGETESALGEGGGDAGEREGRGGGEVRVGF